MDPKRRNENSHTLVLGSCPVLASWGLVLTCSY
jgi:hypothetical protein